MGAQPAKPAELARRLTDYLIGVTGSPSLSLSDVPEVLGGGFVNSIYAFSIRDGPAHLRGDLVLRLAPSWSPAGKLEREHSVQEEVFRLGYPTPEPLLLELDAPVLGGPFQVMRRARGAPLVDQLVRRPWAIAKRMETMADVLQRLHALPSGGFEPRVGTTAERYITPLAAEPAPGVAVAEWEAANRPPAVEPVLCHLDFHPINILFQGSDPTAVIDWENAALGDPVHDVADANLVFTAAPADLPAALRPAETRVRQFMADRFLSRYRSRNSFDDDRLGYFTVLSAARRLWGALQDSADQHGEARGFSSPKYIASLATVIEQHTGIAPVTSLNG